MLNLKEEVGRAVDTIHEFTTGALMLHNLTPAITVFGSGRTTPDNPYYMYAEELGRVCAKNGYTMLTGGGGGVMEAANKGAAATGGVSVGLCISLPHEEEPNPYMNIKLGFKHFYARKVMLVRFSTFYIVMPGGFGTLDELFEVITLMQTHCMPMRPIILIDSDYWGGLIEWFKKTLLVKGTISKKDIDLIYVTDESPEELFEPTVIFER